MKTPFWLETLAAIGLDIKSVSLLDAAMVYGEIGVPIFPLQPNTKIPFAGTNGFQDANTDLKRIESFWRKYPTSNIGIATGFAFSVLDVDTKNEAPGWASAHRLNQSRMLQGSFAQASTPSGGGHLCFAPNNEGNHTAGKNNHGLDFRGVGGYIVAAPSTLENGHYEWVGFAPERFGETFNWDAATKILNPREQVNRKLNTGKAASGVGALVNAVRGAKEGNRNAILHWAAMRCVESGVDPIVLMDAALSIGLDEREVASTIRSAVKAGA